jgi:TonB-dependent SusC/RagA subfamily outer membrane receptor
MKTLSLKLFTLLALAGSTAFAQEPADTLKDVRPFGTHALEMIQEAGVEVVSSPGAPGMTPTIHIRGLGVMPGIHPIYVVNGMRLRNLDGIAPESIEKIEVLKDASAIGIYGMDAAAGVVVVRTRRASQKGFHASYGFTGGFQHLAHEPEPMNLAQWQQYGFYDSPDYVDRTKVAPETAFLQNHHLFAQYGGNKWSVHAGISYLNNDGPYPGEKDNHRRFAASWGAEYHPLKWLSLEMTGRWANSMANFAPSSWLWDYITGIPISQYAGDTEISESWNHFSQTDIQGKLTIRPFPGLYLRGVGALSWGDSEKYISQWEDWRSAYNKDEVHVIYSQRNSKWYQTGVDAGWNGQWKGHSVRVEDHFRWIKERGKVTNFRALVTDLASHKLAMGDDNALMENVVNLYLENTDIPIHDMTWTFIQHGKPDDVEWKENTASLHYDWNNRYGLDFSFYSMWANKELYKGTFCVPAITLLWNPSEEPYLHRVLPAWWSEWSVKASWARTDHYLPVLEYEKWLDANNLLRAIERSHHMDLSTSMKFHAGRSTINLSASWYFNTDDYVLTDRVAPTAKEKVFSLFNGGVDLSLSLQGAAGLFRYSISPWMSYNNNHTTSFTANKGIYYLWDNRMFRVDEGKRLGVVKEIKEEHHGSIYPIVTGGIRVSVGWSRWQFTVAGHGNIGQTIYNPQSIYGAASRYYCELLRSRNVDDLGTTPDAVLPASHFRIDQIRLDYTLPVRKVRLNFFASMENWLLFTKYPGSDPELALSWDNIGIESAEYPSTRRTLFGVSVDF